MSMDVTSTLGPKPIPLPEAPARDFMTKSEWDALFALTDAVLPSITSTTSSSVEDKNGSIVLSDTQFEKLVDDCASALSNRPSRERIKEYLEFRPSEDAKFREDCLRSLAIAPQRGQFVRVMNLLG